MDKMARKPELQTNYAQDFGGKYVSLRARRVPQQL